MNGIVVESSVVEQSWSSWSQVGDLPTSPWREFIFLKHKNGCLRVQNDTCHRDLNILVYSECFESCFIDINNNLKGRKLWSLFVVQKCQFNA